MEYENRKEVDFATYCRGCRYRDLPEIEEIYDKDGNLIDKRKTVCFDCQEISARFGSHIPEKYEEAKA